MSNQQPAPQPAPIPARPIGALVLFLIFLAIVIAVLVSPISNTTMDCPGPLFGKGSQHTDEMCGSWYEARMTWVQFLSIPTIVAGCAMVSRWPRYYRAADGSIIAGQV